MGYIWARWLPEALKAEGCDVVLEPNWRNNGRYRADGRTVGAPNWNFEPNGLFDWHHTGTTSSSKNPLPTRNVLINGRKGLQGPLSQLGGARDGKIHVFAAGRANHAGKMSGAGPTYAGQDGNTVAIGLEIDTDGSQKIPVRQYRAAIRAAAAVLRHYKRDASWALGHAETSVTGKWDPGEGGRTVNLDEWRRDLAECLSYPPGVWHSRVGTNSWGEVDVSELAKGAASKDKGSIKRLQYRIKRANPRKVPADVRKAVKITGVWDAETKAAVKAWQQNVFAPKWKNDDNGFQGGGRLGPRQAKVLFGPRYHLV